MMEKNGLPALSLPLLLIFARPFTYLRKKVSKIGAPGPDKYLCPIVSKYQI